MREKTRLLLLRQILSCSLILVRQEFETQSWLVPVQPESLFKSLRTESQEILWLTARTTGRFVRVLPDSQLDTRASVRIARANDQCHLLTYKPRYERYLDCLIAHECGHLLRLWSVPSPERLLPSVRAEQRRMVNRRLLSEMPAEALLLPPEAVKELLSIWHAGVVRQVTNYPIDLRIQRWLFKEYPGMGDLHREALREQLREDQAVLAPEIEFFTPPPVYEVSVIMNCAFASRISEMLGESSPPLPYPKRLAMAANELLAILDRGQENNHRGDIRIVNRWAQRLSIGNWYTWVRLEN